MQDQLAERESQAAAAEKMLNDLRLELATVKERDLRNGRENERLSGDVNELKMHLEKVSFESKEALITMDGLKEANLELTAELDEVKQHLLDVKVSAKETSAVLDEKEKKKAERMAKMMAGFDLGDEVFSENERMIRDIIEKVDVLTEISASGDPVAADDLRALRSKLQETQGVVRQTELSLHQHSTESESELKKREDLETKLSVLHKEYEQVLERGIDSLDITEVRTKLESAYNSKRNVEEQMLDDLKLEIAKKSEENEKLKRDVEEVTRKAKLGAGAATNGVAASLPNGKTVQQQIAEFDVMKKSLMRDLQNRCERVCQRHLPLFWCSANNGLCRSSN